ncbi:MAG: NAD-dependent epimerase/dehydratase family protein [Lachnospiraceae bacterium]|nr:NAD-dependent epimerase/dehydratase family protein [Lachnospiraceae bacterium]
MKVALVGSSGYIAGFLLKRFNDMTYISDVIKIDQTETADEYLNLLEAEKFNYSILNNVDYVIFTAAISGPDQCAKDFELCWSINVIGTIYFIREAIKKRCKVLFFSSDAVFGDIPGTIYTENSKTEAKTAYGCMKKAVEDEFKGDDFFKAIRLSYVVSTKDKFVSYCLECIRKNESADIYHPFYRNCIGIDDVLDVVMWMIRNWDNYPPFVLNVAGKELVSRVRIADELNRLLGNKLKYSISEPMYEFYTNRPCITQMTSLYLPQYKILEDITFTEKLKKIFDNYY